MTMIVCLVQLIIIDNFVPGICNSIKHHCVALRSSALLSSSFFTELRCRLKLPVVSTVQECDATEASFIDAVWLKRNPFYHV